MPCHAIPPTMPYHQPLGAWEAFIDNYYILIGGVWDPKKLRQAADGRSH